MSFTFNGVAQILVYFVILVLITKPMGLYLTAVFSGRRTWLGYIFRPVERGIYKLCGVDEEKEQDWKVYAVSMLLFTMVTVLLLYAIERLQAILPGNPAGQSAVDPLLAFNTAVSFSTNTNWQNYTGETTMSYFTQMAGLAFHNFASAGVGVVLAVVIIRALTRRSTRFLGNFWVDLTRVCLYVLLPICFIFALFLVWQGVPENFNAYTQVTGIQGFAQTIAQGPVASQEAIKMLGTNGGGFFNANSAHPFENPTPFSNLVEMLSIFTLGAGLIYMFGNMARNRKQGWILFAAVSFVFLLGAFIALTRRSQRLGSTKPRRNGPSPSPAAIWRARRCALASAPPRCSPPSPPMPRAAPSIAGTIATRRSAAWCRSSTSSSARSSSAALARASMA